MYDAMWLISLLTHCPWVYVRNGHKRKKKLHTLSLSLSLLHTHTRTHQKEIDSVILQSLLAQIARQLYDVVSQRTGSVDSGRDVQDRIW